MVVVEWGGGATRKTKPPGVKSEEMQPGLGGGVAKSVAKATGAKRKRGE